MGAGEQNGSALDANRTVRHPRVLAVDDEPAVIVLISRVLRKAGYDVLTAGTAEDALNLARRAPPDLLVVDKNLPRMNGFALLREVRALHPDVPALIITATPEAGLPPEKIDGYLAKPFRSLDALRVAVTEALERHQAARERQALQRQLQQVVSQLRK